MSPQSRLCPEQYEGHNLIRQGESDYGTLRFSILILAAAAHAQNKQLTFDVASVKPATVPEGITINGTIRVARRGVTFPVGHYVCPD